MSSIFLFWAVGMTYINGLISPEGILSYIRGMISDSLEGASNEDKVQITTDTPTGRYVSPGADGGTRTRTDLSIQRILSPLRLPFRHIGACAKLG